MASNRTGNGMSLDLKLQAKAVRAVVEQRQRKADNGVDREHWLQPTVLTTGERNPDRVPRIRGRDRQAIACAR